ncbi:polysaccharide deacetylase family protein [Paenibacillaceae bacterium]|nr:polysaccharide deacetylase family protein [Paenibacillaceae bacterium]
MIVLLAVSLFVPALKIPYRACMVYHKLSEKAFIVLNPAPEIDYPATGEFDSSRMKEGERRAERIPVLMYHYLIPKKENKEPGNISILNLEVFEENMRYLHEQGYYTATLEELERFVHGGMALPEKTVVLTFDDGYENNYTYAYPILKEYNFHAALFMIAGRIQEEDGKPIKTHTSYLTQQQIDASRDVFEYHSHTYDLHYLKDLYCGRKLSAASDGKLLKEDIPLAKAAGLDTPYFAYPYGEFNYRTLYYLKKENYRMAFTVNRGFAKPGDDPMKLQRLNVTSTTDFPYLLETGQQRESIPPGVDS